MLIPTVLIVLIMFGSVMYFDVDTDTIIRNISRPGAELGSMQNQSQTKPEVPQPEVAQPEVTQLYNDGRGNDIILSLVRNEELTGMLRSITQLEERFNKRFHYDWWFMNDKPFTQEFIDATTEKVSGRTKYITIP